MKTLAILSRKGGTGKTTLALHLAVAARSSDRSVLLADLDRQGSAVEWRRQRGRNDPAVEAVKPGALFTRQQDAAREGLDLLIIDTPPSTEDEVADVVRCADLCLIVARPNFLDLRAVEASAELAARMRRPAIFVLNQAPHRQDSIEAPVLMEAVKAVRGFGFPVAPIGLRSRVAYQNSIAAGAVAGETDPTSAAAMEMAALWRHLSGQLWAEAPRPAPAVSAQTDRFSAYAATPPSLATH